MSDLKNEKLPLHYPPLEEVAKVLQDGLKKNFRDVEVLVVDCPDLTQEPFMLADKGLCGNPCLADVGGTPYLLPVVQRDKVYQFTDIAALTHVPEPFILGAGACIPPHLGFNSEMVPNVKIGSHGNDNSHCAWVKKEDDSYHIDKIQAKAFCLLMNLYLSEGKPGKVLRVKAGRRSGPTNYMTCLREVLASHYGDKPVGLGGAFLIEKGKAWIHVMPDFAKKPLNTDADVKEWLKFYEMDAPLVCLGHLVSHDPGVDLRMEHFHCFSKHGDGGHYHNDTTPDDVSYLGYFNVGEFMYRIDQPVVTNDIYQD